MYVCIYRKRKGKLLLKNKEISGRKACTNTDVFLDQKRVYVCEHMVKKAPRESFIKLPPGGLRERKGEDGGKVEWKSSEVNTSAVSRGQNELIGMCKMSAGDVIDIRRLVMDYTYILTGIKRELVRFVDFNQNG